MQWALAFFGGFCFADFQEDSNENGCLGTVETAVMVYRIFRKASIRSRPVFRVSMEQQ